MSSSYLSSRQRRRTSFLLLLSACFFCCILGAVSVGEGLQDQLKKAVNNTKTSSTAITWSSPPWASIYTETRLNDGLDHHRQLFSINNFWNYLASIFAWLRPPPSRPSSPGGPATSAPVPALATIVPAPPTTTPAPVAKKTDAPVAKKTDAPVAKPTDAPVTKKTNAPAPKPTDAPVTKKTDAPAPKPTTASPVAKVTTAPIPAPVAPPPTSPSSFAIRINCGSAEPYVDDVGRTWLADDGTYVGTGKNFSVASSVSISDTTNPTLYRTERFGAFTYNIAVPAKGNYDFVVHLSEIFFTDVDKRKFDIVIENGKVIQKDIDIVQLGGGVAKKAIILRFGGVAVTDGSATIKFQNSVPKFDLPKLSALEVLASSATSTSSPILAPTTKAPVVVPTTKAPVLAPTTMAPVLAPVTKTPTTVAPATKAPTVPASWAVRINSGSTVDYTDVRGRLWVADTNTALVNAGVVGSKVMAISGTEDDPIYYSERYGQFEYKIPVPAIAEYDVFLHFSETFFTEEGKRLFSVIIEGNEEPNLDLIKMGGGVAKKALVLNRVAIVEDGILNIFFKNSNPKINNPKVSGIEVKFKKVHVAHSVPGDTYFAVDADRNGFEDVAVDGSGSHTHGEDLYLTDWIWKKGTTVLGLGEKANLRLPVGVHMVDLTVIDNAGNDDTYTSEITVVDGNFPKITDIVPAYGSLNGGDVVTIVGSGFDTIVEKVKFGLVELTGSSITVLNSTAISVVSPSSAFGVPVSISVTTSIGATKPNLASTYTYISPTQIHFEIRSLLQNFQSPSSVAFGPDGKLYVSTTKGKIGRFLMNDDFTAIVNVEVVATCTTNRAIIGIAFDPNDAGVPFPPIYFAHSKFYHDEPRNSVGMAVNGKISRASGANLDNIVDIVSNLPVSQHDHGINGMEFGDHGELYFQIGGNTNGGIPGELSTSGTQRENFFSAATLVANLGQGCFNGQITYDAVVDGSPVTGFGPNGVEIFAAGNRNPYDLVLHSNGYLYGTDNGPNNGFGDMATGCGPGEFIPDKSDSDKLNLLERGKYYGHPNHKRASYFSDNRQCKWRTASEPSDSSYTAPLTKLSSSTNGIVEFQTNHFGGLMRGNLVVCKYQDGLKRIILTPDGRGVESVSVTGITLPTAPEGGGDDGLDVTQAPNGNLILGKYGVNALDVLVPLELPITDLRVVGVFPRRGPLTGGSRISIFGNNFGSEVTVLLGGKQCSKLQVIGTSRITCEIPIGDSLGTVDLSVSSDSGSSTFSRAYRYIRGAPESSTC